MLRYTVAFLGMLIISGPTWAVPITFSNPGAITIPAGAPGVTSGIASPYPSNIVVSGFTGSATDVNVTLSGLSHTFPDDIDILLVGPTGLKTLLMSDAGGALDVVNINLTFDDAAPGNLPNSTLIAAGSYRPTDFSSGDLFPAPAPVGPYGANLGVFNGVNPNGIWSLYVVDDTGVDVGTIAGGWSLTIDAPIAAPEPSTLGLIGLGLLGLGAMKRRRRHMLPAV